MKPPSAPQRNYFQRLWLAFWTRLEQRAPVRVPPRRPLWLERLEGLILGGAVLNPAGAVAGLSLTGNLDLPAPMQFATYETSYGYNGGGAATA